MTDISQLAFALRYPLNLSPSIPCRIPPESGFTWLVWTFPGVVFSLCCNIVWLLTVFLVYTVNPAKRECCAGYSAQVSPWEGPCIQHTSLFCIKRLAFSYTQFFWPQKWSHMHKELLQLQFFLLYSVISKVICEVTKQRSWRVNCMLAFRQHNPMEPRAQYNYTVMFIENGFCRPCTTALVQSQWRHGQCELLAIVSTPSSGDANPHLPVTTCSLR